MQHFIPQIAILSSVWNHIKRPSPPLRSISSSSPVSHLRPSLGPAPGFDPTRMQQGVGRRVLLRGLDQADYLLTASRTACNIPGRLLCSPALICPNKPGLAASQKDQVTIWTSKGGKGVTWHPASEVEASTRQMLLTNVHWAYSSRILGWSTGFYWGRKSVWCSSSGLIFLWTAIVSADANALNWWWIIWITH